MPVIEMSSVEKTYGDVAALDGVDLTIERGELVAVLGPNGAGKTTMFELILGLIAPTSGSLRTLGRRPGARASAIRSGVMLQRAGLPEFVTVREVVGLVAASYPRPLDVPEALNRVGLGSRAGHIVTSLSGGERQRLLLAMAIVGVPDLLLLDEPTAAMDAEGRRSFWAEATAAVADGTTLVFATHDLGEADAVARRVVVLRGGRMVADTTPAEMKGMISPKTVTFRTTMELTELQRLPGTDHVEIDGVAGRVRILTPTPERLVAAIAERGHPVDDLLVSEAGLEDAFISLMDGEGE